MKTLWTLTVLALLAAPLAAAPLTDEERGRLLDHLEKTRNVLLEEVEGLSEAQWNYKTAPDRWSIAECTEHIARTEEFLRERITGFMKEPASADRKPVDVEVETMLKMVTDRSQRFQAPEPLQVTRRWASGPEALAFFEEQRAKAVDQVKNGGDLRSYLEEHPALGGDADAYVWFFFMSGHTARHTLQIQEVKADPGFPKS